MNRAVPQARLQLPNTFTVHEHRSAVKGNGSCPFTRRGYLCLWPLVAGLLILVANCLSPLEPPKFM